MEEIGFGPKHETKLYFYCHLLSYLSYVNEKQNTEIKITPYFFNDVAAVYIFDINIAIPILKFALKISLLIGLNQFGQFF